MIRKLGRFPLGWNGQPKTGQGLTMEEPKVEKRSFSFGNSMSWSFYLFCFFTGLSLPERRLPRSPILAEMSLWEPGSGHGVLRLWPCFSYGVFRMRIPTHQNEIIRIGSFGVLTPHSHDLIVKSFVRLHSSTLSVTIMPNSSFKSRLIVFFRRERFSHPIVFSMALYGAST